MTAKNKSIAYEEIVSFDQDGKMTVNKDAQSSKKLVARRVIEAHLEKKRLEQDFDDYFFSDAV